MKGNTTKLFKFQLLQDELELPYYATVGLLQTLWMFVADNCPAGDIGRFTNKQIALGIGWPTKDADALIEALMGDSETSGWLDEDEEYRLVIHDWSEHCEDSVHTKLTRAGKVFADGTVPKMTKLNKSERRAIQERYAHEMRTKPQSVRTNNGNMRTKPQSVPPTKPILSSTKAKPSIPKTEGNTLEGREEPTAIGDTLEELGGSDFKAFEIPRPSSRKELAKALAGFHLVSCNTDYGWVTWYETVMARYEEKGCSLWDFEELLRRVWDATDPRTRQAKDLGEFKDPDLWLSKQATKLLKTVGVRWPDFPSDLRRRPASVSGGTRP